MPLRTGEDFEKGEGAGSQTLLHIIDQIIRIWRQMRRTGEQPTPGL